MFSEDPVRDTFHTSIIHGWYFKKIRNICITRKMISAWNHLRNISPAGANTHFRNNVMIIHVQTTIRIFLGFSCYHENWRRCVKLVIFSPASVISNRDSAIFDCAWKSYRRLTQVTSRERLHIMIHLYVHLYDYGNTQSVSELTLISII